MLENKLLDKKKLFLIVLQKNNYHKYFNDFFSFLWIFLFINFFGYYFYSFNCTLSILLIAMPLEIWSLCSEMVQWLRM